MTLNSSIIYVSCRNHKWYSFTVQYESKERIKKDFSKNENFEVGPIRNFPQLKICSKLASMQLFGRCFSKKKKVLNINKVETKKAKKKEKRKGKSKTKKQMTNIMVNKIQHNAILVMTYQNIRCFLRTLGCAS
jgi:hypothetical protein